MLIDFHCHLDLYKNPHQIASECGNYDIKILSVTTTPSAWKGTNELAKGNKNIRTALGLHPQLAHERKFELDLFDELLPQSPYVGEIGLDGSPELQNSWKDQVSVFEHILNSCQQSGGRIMSIHSRRASSDVLNLLDRYPDAGSAVLHWYSGSTTDLKRAISSKCWFSVGLHMLVSKKGRDHILRMPKNRILTETDGPFTQDMGEPIMPWAVEKATVELANLWSLPAREVEDILRNNLKSLLKQNP